MKIVFHVFLLLILGLVHRLTCLPGLYDTDVIPGAEDASKRLVDGNMMKSKFISRFGRARARLSWGKRNDGDWLDDGAFGVGVDKRIPIGAFYGKPWFFRRYGRK